MRNSDGESGNLIRQVFSKLLAAVAVGGLAWGIYPLVRYECKELYGVYGFLTILIGVVAGGFWVLSTNLDDLMEEFSGVNEGTRIKKD